MVRLTDRPDMTLDVYRGRKTTMQRMMAFKIESVCDIISDTRSNLNTLGIKTRNSSQKGLKACR